MDPARPAVARRALDDEPAHSASSAGRETQKVGVVAHFHYVMDLYYPSAGKPRHEALRIEVEGDEAAIAEAKRIDLWRKPGSFQVRSINTTARSGDRLVYRSAATDDPVALPAIEPLGVSS